MGHCRVLPTLCSFQAEVVVVGSQQGLLCGSIGMVTIGPREPFVNGFTASPHSIQIPYLRRQGPSTYEAILLDHPQQNTVLKRCGLPRGPRGPAWHQSSSDSMPPEDAFEGSTSQTHVTSSGTLPHAVKGKCKHSMSNTYTVGRGIIRLISENWENICNCWFELVTVRRQLGGNDHLSCSFEFWRSHLALKWKSGQGKVRFRWGAVTGTFHVNFSALEAQKFDPYRFYCFIWGVNNIFFQECTMDCGQTWVGDFVATAAAVRSPW